MKILRRKFFRLLRNKASNMRYVIPHVALVESLGNEKKHSPTCPFAGACKDTLPKRSFFVKWFSCIRKYHTLSCCTLLCLIQGWGTYLLSQAALIVEYRWRAAKNNFILKFYLNLQKEIRRENSCVFKEREYLNLLSTCLLVMELNLDAELCSNLVTTLLMRGILNVHEGRIFPAGGQIPRLWFKQ